MRELSRTLLKRYINELFEEGVPVDDIMWCGDVLDLRDQIIDMIDS